MLNVKVFTCNPLGENTYIVHDDLGEAIFIDCGAYTEDERNEIKSYVEKNNLRPIYHLLTHGHFDHAFGAQFLYDTYGLTPHVHEADSVVYPYDKELATVVFHKPIKMDSLPEARYFAEGARFKVGNAEFEAIHTPGHTPGGTCFFCESEKVLFSGDSLFMGTIGRCNFPMSSEMDLLRSLRTKILTLPKSTVVYPGHGTSTTIEREINENFFF